MSSMKDVLSHLDENKLATVARIKQAYESGALSLEDARAQLKQEVSDIKAYELAFIEETFTDEDPEQCVKEDIQDTLTFYDQILDTSHPELDPTHPIARYYQELEAMEQVLLQMEDLVQYPVIKNQWAEVYDQLLTWRTHLSRKQNQLYSVLEQKGFTRPTTTMWTLDDVIRDEISEGARLLQEVSDDATEEAFISHQHTLIADIRDLNQKESTVLYPTSLEMISADEFEHMKSGDAEIGFALIEVSNAAAASSGSAATSYSAAAVSSAAAASPATANTSAAPASSAAPTSSHAETSTTSAFELELHELIQKHKSNLTEHTQLHVAEGSLTLEQINLIYKHLPVDLSYVDENEIVKFYSDTKHRVFPRSKNVIGRNVKNCHPRRSVHVVEEIIEKFRSGEQTSAEFWINKPNLFIYITYVAVRDEHGNFRGILEMMQDCTHIRSLEGSRTLLTWENEHGEKPTDAAAAPEPAAPTDAAAAPEPAASTDAAAPEPAASQQAKAPAQPTSIDANTKLKDLLAIRPQLKEELLEISDAFAMLNSPLARVMLPKVTVQMMSERSGVELSELVEKLQQIMARA